MKRIITVTAESHIGKSRPRRKHEPAKVEYWRLGNDLVLHESPMRWHRSVGAIGQQFQPFTVSDYTTGSFIAWGRIPAEAVMNAVEAIYLAGPKRKRLTLENTLRKVRRRWDKKNVPILNNPFDVDYDNNADVVSTEKAR